MGDYTPTTEQVRRYWQYGANAWADGVARDDDQQPDMTQESGSSSIGEEFDRWLGAVISKAKTYGYSEGYKQSTVDQKEN